MFQGCCLLAEELIESSSMYFFRRDPNKIALEMSPRAFKIRGIIDFEGHTSGKPLGPEFLIFDKSSHTVLFPCFYYNWSGF